MSVDDDDDDDDDDDSRTAKTCASNTPRSEFFVLPYELQVIIMAACSSYNSQMLPSL